MLPRVVDKAGLVQIKFPTIIQVICFTSAINTLEYMPEQNSCEMNSITE